MRFREDDESDVIGLDPRTLAHMRLVRGDTILHYVILAKDRKV